MPYSQYAGEGGVGSSDPYSQMMKDPKFQRILQAMLEAQKKKRGGLAGAVGGQGNAFANLGKQLPRFQEEQQKFKIQDAERKAAKLKLDWVTKQAEQQANQQQMQQAQNSV